MLRSWLWGGASAPQPSFRSAKPSRKPKEATNVDRQTDRSKSPERATLHRPEDRRRQNPLLANALKTGLYTQKELMATESREDYEALVAEYHDHFAPANPHERSLVDALSATNG